ncbi:MAG: hypothetical protein M3R25_15870 [Bacteroidota bacterium]|nr:hypothetical protein [Bacteroidota bacterium]
MIIQKEVLITDYVHPVLLQGLKDLGFTWTYAPEMSREEMNALLPGYQGVVINTRCGIDRKTLESTDTLKWIGRLGSGLDIIDLLAAAEKHVHVISAPEGNAQAVAEHALGMLLCLSNKLIQADQSVRQGQWIREENRGWEIEGKTLGIIGYGNNGSAFGRLWSGWDVRVVAYDKYLDRYGNEKIIAVDLPTLLKQADIISLHIPLTTETKGMINNEFIARCKRNCVLINTSRGKVADMEAILQNLKSGHLKGACLDVLPFEPPSSGPEAYIQVINELFEMDNVVLSPHIAGWTVESKKKISETIITKLGSWLKDKG